MLRVNDTLTGSAERRVLASLCRRMPAWITSDMLTLLGVVGAVLSFLGYALSASGPAFLWLAIAGVVINWLGDSLDGSLARHRQAERPKYGFFLDHMTDTLAIGLIALGIGLSPYAQFASGLAILISYYLMVILSLATCLVTGVFRISFNKLGPTEIRLFIVACTISGILLPTPTIAWGEFRLTLYDLIMAAVTAMLILTCGVEAIKTARTLAAVDPPRA
jgi:archaetidylinositol phosphate synthase